MHSSSYFVPTPKDNHIEKLNENMHKQAVHIQTLIQENSKLNTKLLPENTENKKPWWKLMNDY